MRVEKSAVVARDADRTNPSPARQRTEGFGGPRLKLSVPQMIAGYHLYYENDDDDGAIEQLLHEGFSFVLKSEVGLSRGVKPQAVVPDDDITERVSRYVGKKADGTAMRAYLLKCPEALWAEREVDRHNQADDREESIRSEQRNNSPGRYAPKGSAPVLDPNYRKEY